MFPCHFRAIFLVFVQTLCVCIIHVYFRYVCVYAFVKVSVDVGGAENLQSGKHSDAIAS